MSIFEKHLEVTAARRGLPNAKSVASYNFVDQLVLFETIESTHVAACLARPTPPERYQLKKDIWINGWHEYTHWLDMTTSVFGLRWLSTLQDLLENYPRDNQAPPLAYIEKSKAANREMAGIHLPEYYSTVENRAGWPWLYASTVGQAFDTNADPNPSHPLWFIRFNTPAGLSIARQPISVASLLEVRAVKAELVGGYGLINSLPDRAFQAIEEKLLSADILGRLYAPDLTVYSAAAHWYANHRHISDAAEAYRAASELAWFCLDAPSQWISALNATSDFKNRMGDEFAQMMSLSLLRGDRGALFFMLASDSRLRSLKSLRRDLDSLVSMEWRMNLREINESARTERNELLQRLLGASAPVADLVNVWKHNLDRRCLDAPLSVASANIKLPAVILADDVPLNIFNLRLGDRAFDDRTFDPRPYFEEFFKPHLAMKRHGSYSLNGLHCFSTTPAARV